MSGDVSRESILQLVYDSVDEVNAQLNPDRHVAKAPETSLVIGAAGLDSLAYVNLITAVEEKCEERFGHFVSLWDDASTGASYDTIGDLAEHVLAKLR
jgi:acyl carrier protein